VQLYEPPRRGEAEPRPTVFGREERLEHPRAHVTRHPRSGVPELQGEVIRAPKCGDANPSTARHGLRGVQQQVRDYDLQQLRVGADRFGAAVDLVEAGVPVAATEADLAALGVKTVIDLQEDGLAIERQFVESAGMKFFRIPMNTRRAPTNDDLSRFLQLVNDPANQPVYVHCAGGRHRTGVMTAVYRMSHDGWNSDRAFKEMKQYDFGADFLHPEFKRFVYGYHSEPKAPIAVEAVAATAAAN